MKDDALPPQVARPAFLGALAVLCFLTGLIAYAGFVPLATTLTLSGRLVSSTPEVVLQPPYGGPVAEVLVARHDHVAAGDVLLRLDTTVETKQVAAVQAQQARLRAENAVITALLTTDMPVSVPVSGPVLDGAAGHGHEYALQMQLAYAEHQAKQQSVGALAQQITLLEGEVALTERQLSGMQARADRQAGLLQKGVLKRTEVEAFSEQVLMVAAEIEGSRGTLAALRDRQAQMAAQAQIVLLQVRQRLTATRARNIKQLQDIDQHLAELKDRIERATIHAPISGTVTRLDLPARDAYAARGKTVLAIAQPLAQPHLELTVPTTYIDQLRPGMVGRLVLPSLPQRAMPRIETQLAAISPRAALDEAGQPTGFAAQADLSLDASQRLASALSDLRLSEDMPVQVIIEVRETTLAQYLLAPLAAAFQRALQD
ncbi:HlyD family efflux transporter periplasmic adaptor subunit [Thalassovita mediterranea]|jgi:HlyD family secretion protein|uniref:Type I secretion system membrane fusion protein PrsE n=1 Tax=Thalassovita mediterranea TaxID=340021 RepID=A0A0P1H774_9RHOB|nr:HlyD family efflux transporter periplasmic adaptor subunit [Thalassovita mediterranea]CUH85812.1 Type I secretion system membrane fusion protein PrsE [Thalassovita mediterranea]SIS32584.1 type I secretion membrane fusion protein, HlyD family [Thalassovita mediterranea]